MQFTRPVWVDTDGGSDDALALLYLVAAGVPIAGVSAVGGVTDVRQAAANAAGVLARVGRHPPVHVGRPRVAAGRDGGPPTPPSDTGGSPPTPARPGTSPPTTGNTGMSLVTPGGPVGVPLTPTDPDPSPHTPASTGTSPLTPASPGGSPLTRASPGGSPLTPTDPDPAPHTPGEPGRPPQTPAVPSGPIIAPSDVGARHGPDGLGGAGFGDSALIATGDAVDRFLHTARRTSRLRVLAIGPMTNLAAALEVEPDLPSRLGAVVCVAGGTAAVRDTNTWVDPDAMRQVLDAFREHGNLAVLTSNATLASPIEREALDRLRTTRSADGLAWRVVAGYQARQSAEAGRGLLVAHDALAAALLLDRSLATGEVHAGGRVVDGRAVPDGAGRIRWVTSLLAAAERVVDALVPGS